MQTCDVLIPTKGDPPYLAEAIASIRRCIPVKNVFRADGGTLGEARQRLIEAATTNRFLMLDSDVILEPGPWFEAAVNSKDCVVFQMPLAVGPLDRFVSFWWKLKPPLKGLFFGTMATFFSKSMLEGIHIPGELSGTEDLYIMLFLMKKKVPIRVVQVPGMHYHSSDPEKGAWVGGSLRVLQKYAGKDVLPLILRNVFLYPLAVSLASMFTRDIEVERYGLALWRRYIAAYFGR